MAGNVIGPNAIGSMEFGCIVGGAKLIVILGHTQSGLVRFAVSPSGSPPLGIENLNCPNLGPIVKFIQRSIDPNEYHQFLNAAPDAQYKIIDEISRRNVNLCVQQVAELSPAIKQLVEQKRVAIVGAMLDVVTGSVQFFEQEMAT